MTSLVVAMLTYRRPRELDIGLPLVLDQVRALDGIAGAVLIVDNDPDGSAR